MTGDDGHAGGGHTVMQTLKAQCAKVLAIPVEDIDEASTFVTLGGDSFKAVHLFQHCVEQGLAIKFQDILHKPLHELAAAAAPTQNQNQNRNGPSSGRRHNGGHEFYHQMPLDYDFSKIFDELAARHNLEPDDVDDIYPCSPMQESMYIGQKMSSKRLYRTRGLFEAQDGFDLDRFKTAWNDIIRRHQTLRTVYVETSDPASGRLLDAVVLKEKSGRVVVTDCDDLDEVHRKFQLGSLETVTDDSGENSQHQITVYTGSKHSKDGRILFEMDLNHLTVDGSSLMVIMDELVRHLHGHAVEGLATGYGKYIDHLRNEVDEDGALDHWIDYLDGAEPCYFPAMNDNQAGGGGSFEVLEMPLETSLDNLRTFCRNQNVTISNALQAAWALVLHAYSGNPDVCFGYLSSGRSLPISGVSEIVGPMMNLLVCRVGGIDGKSMGELLGVVRDDFVSALPHQCFSISKVQRILGTNENKLFNTIMTCYYSSAMSNEDESPFKLVASHNASDFDMVLKAVYSDSQLRVRLAYSSSTLSPPMAQNVSHTFSAILERLLGTSAPSSCLIKQATAVNPEDLRLIRGWNNQNTFPDVPSACVHQLIEERAHLRPDAPAVHAWDGKMTYKELDKAANLVAKHIASLGVGPGAFIPLCFEKSLWYSVALFAVLKSGNAFVPLDVSNPTSRKQEILKQLNASAESNLVLCSRKQAPELASLALHVLELGNEQLSSIKAQHPTHPLPVVEPKEPAYVIFTSGSTGTPKGVVVTHDAYSYATRAHCEGIQINPASRVLQFASYGFDTSMEDHLTTFAAGACLCVPSEDQRLSLPDLAAFATESLANWAHLTPSFAEMLTPSLLPTMKTMVLGGEAMSGKNIRHWANPGSTRLIQVYGPSECCVTSTISPEVAPEDDPTNIGTAVPGCASWVVRPDDPHCLQPIGAVGELLMEGPILAKGYLNSPEQTSETFIRGLTWAPLRRFYRTGDLVKYDSSGQLHFVGRRDGQVKLHGQRMELEEVERQLVLEPGVQHCLALVPESGPCAKRLVGLVTLTESSNSASQSTISTSIEILQTSWSSHISRMRDFLLDRLPPYMSPELWVILKSFPRNSSGKLDRKGMTRYLEDMTQDQYSKFVPLMEDAGSERPGNETELLLREIWSEVLNMPEGEIRWNSSFYYLGGDSISAMTVSSLARSKSLNISAADVLRYRTIDRLAKVITACTQDTATSTAEEGSDTDTWFPLSPIQQLHFQACPEGDPLDQQTMVVQMTKAVGQDILLSGLESLIEAHPMLRARFQRHEGEWMQRIPPSAGVFKDCRVRFHGRDHHAYIIDCVSESKRSLDLENGPLIGVDVFETYDQMLLSITIHHLVIDAVSWRILFRELENFVCFAVRSEPQTTPFRTWCSAQRQFASSLNVRAVLPLSEPVPATDASFWDMQDKQNLFKHSVLHTISFDAELTRSLSSARNTANYVAADIMTAAVVESFYEIFGRSPTVFVEGHGREPFSPSMNPSDTVGWFTTFSPVLVNHHEDSLVTLGSVREFRADTPLNGFSYFTSRFLSKKDDESSKHVHSPMEITLNYLGSFQQFERGKSWFKRCDNELQSKVTALRRRQRANSTRYSLISILAVTKDDELSIEIEWNAQMSHQDQLKDWVTQLEQSLKQITDRLASQELPDSPVESFAPLSGFNSKRLRSAVSLAKSRLGLQACDIESVYPCSPIQDSLMVSQLRNPTNVYSQHFMFKLSGRRPLRPERLSAAWKQVVATHPIMRTVFLEGDDGTFQQVVLKSVSPEVEILTLKDESDLPDLWARQSNSAGPSPLSGKVLHKLKMYAAKDGSVYCLLDKNHIITDGTTSRLLIRNFMDAYEGHPRADVSPYANYIKYTSEQDMGEITEYWARYLNGAGSCQFPRLRQAPIAVGEAVEFVRTTSVIPDRSTLESACRTLDLTVPIIFQAAWAVVLSTYLNSNDVIFGILCHGRDTPIPGAQEIVGPMASTVPIRAQLVSKTKISGVFNDLQEDSITHMSRQAISLARIQHTANRSGEAMFNSILNFQKTGTSPPSAKIKSELVFAHDTSEYDIAVCITEDHGRLDITIETPSHFMSEAQAQRLLAVYVNAVHSMIRNPDATIGELSLATDLDDDQMQEWHSVELEASKRCIHEMISETTLRQPSKPAISSWDGDMSYAQLDIVSTKLAAQLRSMGAKPDEVIVLCFEKSMWAVVAMLAVAKSGAAFVHIDPKGAPKRTESVIKQTKARIGLASLDQYDNFISLIDTILIVNKTSIMGLPTPNTKDLLLSSAEPHNILYIIFTSGTTGAPKGVMIQHRSFCSAATANRSWLQIKPTSRVLQFTNYCFDASIEEIFTVLVSGGCICIPSDKERMSDVPGFVERKNVNWAAFTPSFLRTLDPEDLKPVRFITVHAEPMGRDLVERWAEKIHMRPSYGPTECSVTSTVGSRFNADTDATNIGFPVGCRGWVVHPDNHDILMPIGAVGELILDGPIVGKGYLNDEAKTRAAFIDPPPWATVGDAAFSSWADRKLYKTGDLVRYAEDGSLLIQRRKDHSQVKVRGQRVELGEIQHHLNNLSGIIQHSMVLMPNVGLLKGRLVAVASLTALSAKIDPGINGYHAIRVVSQQDLDEDQRLRVDQSLDEITTSLAKQLPQYMVPETWLFVHSLPVQLSLKLDRQRLISWVEELDQATLETALELHQQRQSQRLHATEMEETVRGIWGRVLGIDAGRIALDQSFFRLGGDSIYAMQVMRLCKKAGLQVTTQDVLANPTVQQLAAVATVAVSAPSSVLTPPWSPNDSVPLSPYAKHILNSESNVTLVIPCSPFQERMYRAFHHRPQSPYLFNSLVELNDLDQGNTDIFDRIVHAWQQTVDRHAILRTVFVEDAKAGRLLQKILKSHKADISTLSVGSETEAIEQSQVHLGVTRSTLFKEDVPPLSIRLFVTLESQVFVHFVMGHMLIDHVSLAHIFSDFANLYRGLSPTPVTRSTGFDSYIQHLVHTRDTQESNRFWAERLKDVKPCMVAVESTDDEGSDPHVMGAVTFGVDITGEMRGFLLGAGVTLSNLLQFTWALTLHVYTEDTNVCFGHLVSDRDIDPPHTDEIVGPMLSVMVAKAALDESTVVLEALRNFQEDSISSLTHKTFDLTEVERQLGCDETGLFNTLINYRKVKYAGEGPDFSFRPIWKQDPHEQHLVLAFNEKPSRLEASLSYYESLFSKQTVNTLAETYCIVLEKLLSGQYRTVGEMMTGLNPDDGGLAV